VLPGFRPARERTIVGDRQNRVVAGIEVRRLDAREVRARLDALADVLADAVANGDSVSFLSGFTVDDARAFYASHLPELEQGTRVQLAAFDGDDLVGSVQLVHAWPPNSQYRAEVAKLVVHRRARGRGAGRALMERLEQEARADGKTLLILDTVSGGIADGLYERLGWTRFGIVPDYALDPAGTPCPAAFFYKHL
jgi:GNAT superfamily N-acetyltransferase